MKKILSISVAIYNMEQYLRDCLDSLVSIGEEDLMKCEVILVNDGSTDNSEKIALEYVEQYPETFVLVSKENGGHGSTYNTSIKMATGKYYKLLDADDMVDAKGLKQLIKNLDDTEADVVVNSYNMMDLDSGKLINRCVTIKNVQYGKMYRVDDVMADKENSLQMHAMTFKTKLINNGKVQLPEHCFYVDAPYVIKSTALCNSMIVFDFPVYIYRINRDEQSVSINSYKKHLGDLETVMYDMLQYASLQERLWIKRMVGGLLNTRFYLIFHYRLSFANYRGLSEFMMKVKADFPEYWQYLDSKRRYAMKFGFLGYMICIAYTRIRLRN